MTLPEALMQHRVVTSSGCWEWARGRDSAGYGRLRWGGEIVRVHRLVCHLAHGLDLTDRFEIARHKCDNPPCFNPDHLEPGTIRDNTLDSMKRGRWVKPPTASGDGTSRNKRGVWVPKTECNYGHPLSGENLGVDSAGWRFCRTCRRANSVERITCPECGASSARSHLARHRRLKHGVGA